MSSRGLNVCTLAGNVGATPELKIINQGTDNETELAEFIIYVDRVPSRKQNDSFIVKVTIWPGALAWRKLGYIDKGSLIIVTGKIDVSPYIAKADGKPRAGLQLTAIDIFLDSSPRTQDEAPASTDNFDDIPFS
jgi:single-strand DNA-binding protein